MSASRVLGQREAVDDSGARFRLLSRARRRCALAARTSSTDFLRAPAIARSASSFCARVSWRSVDGGLAGPAGGGEHLGALIGSGGSRRGLDRRNGEPLGTGGLGGLVGRCARVEHASRVARCRGPAESSDSAPAPTTCSERSHMVAQRRWVSVPQQIERAALPEPPARSASWGPRQRRSTRSSRWTTSRSYSGPRAAASSRVDRPRRAEARRRRRRPARDRRRSPSGPTRSTGSRATNPPTTWVIPAGSRDAPRSRTAVTAPASRWIWPRLAVACANQSIREAERSPVARKKVPTRSAGERPPRRWPPR